MTSKWRTITSSIFSNEVVAYCISDVMLLKSGCHKFQQELQQHGEFNPMEKCVTIASACDRYWLEKHLPKDTMAVEPPQGCYDHAAISHSKPSSGCLGAVTSRVSPRDHPRREPWYA